MTLTHPDAPPEQRVSQARSGETLLLDVTMRLVNAKEGDAAVATTDAKQGGGS